MSFEISFPAVLIIIATAIFVVWQIYQRKIRRINRMRNIPHTLPGRGFDVRSLPRFPVWKDCLARYPFLIIASIHCSLFLKIDSNAVWCLRRPFFLPKLNTSISGIPLRLRICRFMSEAGRICSRRTFSAEGISLRCLIFCWTGGCH